MNVILIGLVITASSLLGACSTMSSDFSCKKTALDQCLSIEDVDAHTRFADNPSNHSPVDLEHYLSQREQSHV